MITGILILLSNKILVGICEPNWYLFFCVVVSNVFVYLTRAVGGFEALSLVVCGAVNNIVAGFGSFIIYYLDPIHRRPFFFRKKKISSKISFNIAPSGIYLLDTF